MSAFYLIGLFVLGACLGSFVNVLLYRLPRKQGPWRGRSACPHCGRPLWARDLIPLVSFMVLHGRCRACAGKISWRYPTVEAASGALFVLGGLVLSDGAASWAIIGRLLVYLTAVVFGLILFLYDLDHYLVPDKIVLPGAAVILILNFIFGAPASSVASRIPPALLGAAAGGFWFLWQFLVSRGRWVGGGDIRLGLFAGALLGWPLVWLGLMLSYLGGSLAALLLIAVGKKIMKSRLPFATILLPSVLIVFLWGEEIWRWYLGILGF